MNGPSAGSRFRLWADENPVKKEEIRIQLTQPEKGKIMQKKIKKILHLFCAAMPALLLMAPSSLLVASPQSTAAPQVLSNAVANDPVRFDVSPPLTSLMATASALPAVQQAHAPLKPKQQLTGAQIIQGVKAASSFQPSTGSLVSATTRLSFEGVGQVGGFYSTPEGLNCGRTSGGYVAPPDTNAAVGDTQVVQWVNVCYAVFHKSSGTLIAGPFLGTNFWKGFGAPCETNNDGDIIIQWDKSNHRWLAAQNVFNGPPYYTCVAVSQTADATGSYYRYAFPQQAGFPDYPKWGLTGSAYYQTQNVFGTTSYLGVNVCAYDAPAMLRGRAAKQVCILDNSNGTLFDDSLVPADDDTASETENNAEVLMGSIDNYLPGDSNVYEYVFRPNFGNPAKTTLSGVNGSMPISVPAFDVSYITCVPQPDSASSEAFFANVWNLPTGTTGLVDCLDPLGDRLMYRLAHYTRNGTQHFLVAHSVLNTAAIATRWYEFQARGLGMTNLSLYQAGQTPDDSEYRWMGSVAMDKAGDIVLGYTRSSAAAGDYPSIYYAGQTAGDPPGTTETEALIKQGAGSQYHTFGRWGDYSSMALDGSDSCTFWYTNEFYTADGSFAWDTWLASLKFPSCHGD